MFAKHPTERPARRAAGLAITSLRLCACGIALLFASGCAGPARQVAADEDATPQVLRDEGPADVAIKGVWTAQCVSGKDVFTFRFRFDNANGALSGQLLSAPANSWITPGTAVRGTLRGDEARFSIGSDDYLYLESKGHFDGNRYTGTCRTHNRTEMVDAGRLVMQRQG